MATTSAPRFQYTGLDFDTHHELLLARIQVKFALDFNDFALSGLGMMLMDSGAYGLDSLSFYLDRRALETFLATARTRKAVSRITRQLGYKMGPATSSSTDLQIAVKVPQAFAVPIPKGWQFQGPNGLIYEAAEAITFAPGSGLSTPQSLPVYEGETITETFTSSGTPGQIFSLRRVPPDKNIALGTVRVIVDGVPWVENAFLRVIQTNQFEVAYHDDPATLRFGDGDTGNIPSPGASIKVQYVACRGKAGQVSQGTIQSTVSPLVVNFTTIPLSITNPEASSGGDDPETLEHAKQFAGRVFKAADVVITQEDYEAVAGSFADPLFGKVAVAQAISSRSSESDLELQLRLNNIRSAAQEPLPVITTQTTAAEQELTEAATACSSLEDLFTEMASSISAQLVALDGVIQSARNSKNLAIELLSEMSGILTTAADAKTRIESIPTAGTSQLTVADQNTLKGLLDLVMTQISASATPSVSTILSSLNSEISNTGTVKDALKAIGTEDIEPDVLLDRAEQARALVSARIGSSSAQGVRARVAAIASVVIITEGLIDADLEAIDTHFDRILSADCQANLISVPILTRDAAGFYAAPSSSLIQALQTHLDARKGVSQTVQVTSGVRLLVRAALSIHVVVLSNFSEQVTAKAVQAVVDAILRNRNFSQSLDLSEIYTPLQNISGVERVNVTIRGHYSSDGNNIVTSKLDNLGNLIVERSEVVTKGSVEINTELSKLSKK